MLLAQNSNFLLVIEKWLSNKERSMAEEGNATKWYEELTLILGWLLITLYVVTPTQIFSHVLLQKFQILLKMNLGFFYIWCYFINEFEDSIRMNNS